MPPSLPCSLWVRAKETCGPVMASVSCVYGNHGTNYSTYMGRDCGKGTGTGSFFKLSIIYIYIY